VSTIANELAIILAEANPKPEPLPGCIPDGLTKVHPEQSAIEHRNGAMVMALAYLYRNDRESAIRELHRGLREQP
jgi:hypothetical protein